MVSLDVDVEGCKGCGLCVFACPEGVFKMSEGRNTNDKGFLYVIEDSSRCIGCGDCYQVCPDGCIEIEIKK